MKAVQIGSAVKVADENGVVHDALVTQPWGSGPGPDGTTEYDESKGPVQLAINVVFVSADPSKRDCYGRQTEHLSSCMHRSASGGCPGRYWWQE